MIENIYEKLKTKENIKENLIELKAELKKDSAQSVHIKEYQVFYELLLHEDAKIRKNTALILGEIGMDEFLTPLFRAYGREEQLYVKSAYLTAIKKLNYRSILAQLKEELLKLSKEALTEENKKHRSEEMNLLTEMIEGIEGREKHTFCGYQEMSEIALLTNRNHIHITFDKLSGVARKEFGAGVMLKSDRLDKIMEIRTYRELLFFIDGMKTLPADSKGAAEMIARSKLISFLKKRHKEDSAFYFRIEMKSKLDTERKGKFIKRLSMELEHLTNRELLNSAGNYEFEIRLIENKEGGFHSLVKLTTLPDERFTYRRNAVAVSIHPVNAALIIELSKEYLTEDAQVLDPFCGVGTMLIERSRCIKAGTMYGIDIYGDAIRYARENTELAGISVNYINRNFFEFTHEYLFDELITDMPFLPGGREDEELEKTYQRFFKKAREHMKAQGIMAVYTHNYRLLKKYIKQAPYRIEKEFEISMRERTYLVILRCI